MNKEEIEKMYQGELLTPITKEEIDNFEFDSDTTLTEKLLFSAVTCSLNGSLRNPEEAKEFLFSRYNKHVAEHNDVINGRVKEVVDKM